jgi:chromosome segregation ATPase
MYFLLEKECAMKTPRALSAAVVSGGLLFGAVIAAAQAAHQAATPAPNELLAELRAFRADVQQAAKVSVRAQLLVARLRLQEQRINILAGQLNEIRRLITIKESAQIPLASRLRQVEERLRGTATSFDEQKASEAELKDVKARLAQMQKDEQQHRAEELELANQVATEQARWTEFNARLDDLELQLPALQR